MRLLSVMTLLVAFAASCAVLDIPVGSNRKEDAGATSSGASGSSSSGGSGGAGGCAKGAVAVWEDITPAGIDRSVACGMQDVVVDPLDGKTLLLTTCRNGFWRSADCGGTWARVNTGQNAASIDMGEQWTLAVDPVDSQILYTVSWPLGGLWKSSNGGVDWAQLFAAVNVTTPINGSGASLPDLYSVAIDPQDHLHVLASFHQAWLNSTDGGSLESKDGGATWTLHPPTPGMGSGHCIFFVGDSARWLMVSESPFQAGTWLTTDAGSTWKKVSTNQHSLSGCQLYEGANGAIYHSGTNGVFRSADAGLTWTTVLPFAGGATMGLVGDGQQIYASLFLAAPSPPLNPSYAAPELPGDTGWAQVGTQQLAVGAKRLAVDRARHVLYSGNWNAGVFRFVTQ